MHAARTASDHSWRTHGGYCSRHTGQRPARRVAVRVRECDRCEGRALAPVQRHTLGDARQRLRRLQCRRQRWHSNGGRCVGGGGDGQELVAMPMAQPRTEHEVETAVTIVNRSGRRGRRYTGGGEQIGNDPCEGRSRCLDRSKVPAALARLQNHPNRPFLSGLSFFSLPVGKSISSFCN